MTENFASSLNVDATRQLEMRVKQQNSQMPDLTISVCLQLQSAQKKLENYVITSGKIYIHEKIQISTDFHRQIFR